MKHFSVLFFVTILLISNTVYARDIEVTKGYLKIVYAFTDEQVQILEKFKYLDVVADYLRKFEYSKSQKAKGDSWWVSQLLQTKINFDQTREAFAEQDTCGEESETLIAATAESQSENVSSDPFATFTKEWVKEKYGEVGREDLAEQSYAIIDLNNKDPLAMSDDEFTSFANQDVLLIDLNSVRRKRRTLSRWQLELEQTMGLIPHNVSRLLVNRNIV